MHLIRCGASNMPATQTDTQHTAPDIPDSANSPRIFGNHDLPLMFWLWKTHATTAGLNITITVRRHPIAVLILLTFQNGILQVPLTKATIHSRRVR